MKFTNEQIAILDRAYKTLGRDSQVAIAIEEMAELTKELCKNLTRGRDNVAGITEELADVYVVLAQIKNMYGIDDAKLDQIAADKIERLHQRLDQRAAGGAV
ncbi:MAG: hypothetical protein FWD15_02865 [Alphaproteobacteria bacterium]|nr:hypothetical protein [Alphaproteobacteria bacterium]